MFHCMVYPGQLEDEKYVRWASFEGLMDAPISLFLTFWCHVAKRPSISGEFVSSFRVLLLGINFFCQTKVKDLHIPTDIEPDVIRLEIPINNTV
jgi:hypothetical protein